MKAQISFELLVSFAVVITFVLLIAMATQQYSHFASMNELKISNSIAAVSNSMTQTAPIVIHYS